MKWLILESEYYIRSPVRLFGKQPETLIAGALQVLPPHTTCIHLFGGEGELLFAKEPAKLEIYNDLDPDTAFIYKFLRNATDSDFNKAINNLEVKSISHFLSLGEKVKNKEYKDSIDRFSTLLRYLNYAKHPSSFGLPKYKQYLNFPARLEPQRWIKAREKLRSINLKILQKDFREVLDIYDKGKDTFIWADPPYYQYEHYYFTSEIPWDSMQNILESIKSYFIFLNSLEFKDLLKNTKLNVFSCLDWHSEYSTPGEKGRKLKSTLIVSNIPGIKNTWPSLTQRKKLLLQLRETEEIEEREKEAYGHASMKTILDWVKDTDIKAVIFTHFGKEFIEKGLSYAKEALGVQKVRLHFAKDGEEILVRDIIRASKVQLNWDKYPDVIVVIPDYVSFVGGIVKSEKHQDHDVLIRDEYNENLYVLLGKKLQDPEHNLHFIFHPQGAHDDYIPIYDLVLLKRKKPEIKSIETEYALKEAFKPLQIFKPAKMGAAYGMSEFFKAEEAWNKWVSAYIEKGIPIFVEPKFNGRRIVLEWDGKDSLIFFEDTKEDRSKILKCLVEEIRKMKSVILDAEIGAIDIKTKKAIPRKDLAFLGSKKPIEDCSHIELPDGTIAKLEVNVFDILYWDNKDISTMPQEERRAFLEEIFKQYKFEYLKLSPARIVKNKQQFLDAIKWASNFSESEGAVLKAFGGIYTPEAMPSWAKLKKFLEVKVEVMGKSKVKGSERTYNYDIGIRVDGDIIKIGRTFNTNVNAEIGDILTIRAEEIIPVFSEELNKWLIAIQEPKVRDIDTDRKEPETIKEILNRALRAGNLQATQNILNELRKANLLEALKKEEKGNYTEHFYKYVKGKSGTKFKFVIQEHERGLTEEDAKNGIRKDVSIHTDLRFQLEGLNFLIGLTIATPGNEKQKNKVLTGEKALVAGFKQEQPLNWLEVGKGKFRKAKGIYIPYVGKIPVTDIFPPGDVGATTNTWARFSIIDEGEGELGEVKEHFIEFFFNGKKGILKGRYILQGVPAEGLKWEKANAIEGRVWLFSYSPKERKEK
jgi:hypothetical protein